MRSILQLAFVLSAISVALQSCYKEDPVQPVLGLDYFPMEVGKWVEYEVDSVWRDDPIGPIGSGERHYQLRELNESSFIDDENRPSVRIERFKRISDTLNWDVTDVWSKTRTTLIAEQNEENVIFIKHNFPIEPGKEWLGNNRSDHESIETWLGQSPIPADWNYMYQDVHQAYTVNGLTFDSTVTVVQIDRPAAFGLNLLSQEVYALNIGLIHREITVYDIQQNPDTPSLKDTVGFVFEQRITAFGE